MPMQQQATIETIIIWPGEANSVAIRGTFSDDKEKWWRETIPLKRADSEAQYSVMLALRPGRYEFKYVLNGSDWCISTDRYDCANDGDGNTNNVIIVPAKETADNEPKWYSNVYRDKASSVRDQQNKDRISECQGLHPVESRVFGKDSGYGSTGSHAHTGINGSNSRTISDRESESTTACANDMHDLTSSINSSRNEPGERSRLHTNRNMDKQAETATVSAVASTLDCDGSDLPKYNYTLSVAVPKDHPVLSSQPDVAVQATISFVADSIPPLVVALQPSDSSKDQSADTLGFSGTVDIAKSDVVARVLHHVNGEEVGILTIDPAFNDAAGNDDCASDGQTDSGVQSAGGPVSALKRLGQMDSADSSCMDLTLSDIQRVSSQPLDSANQPASAQTSLGEKQEDVVGDDSSDAQRIVQDPVSAASAVASNQAQDPGEDTKADVVAEDLSIATSADHVAAEASQTPVIAAAAAAATIGDEPATSASADPAPAQVSTAADPQPAAVPSADGDASGKPNAVATIDQDLPSASVSALTDTNFPTEQIAPVDSETVADSGSARVETEHAPNPNSAGSSPSLGASVVDPSPTVVGASAPETEAAADPETVIAAPPVNEPGASPESDALEPIVAIDGEPKAPEIAASAPAISEEPVESSIANIESAPVDIPDGTASENPAVDLALVADEPVLDSAVVEEDEADVTIGVAVEPTADSAIPEEPPVEPVSEAFSAAADQPNVDSAVVDAKADDPIPIIVNEPVAAELAEENKPEVSDAVDSEEAAHETVVIAAAATDEKQVSSAFVDDEVSAENANDSIANAEEPAVEDRVPISSLVVDESVPEESSVISRSLEVPTSTDASEVSSAADKPKEEETAEAVAEVEEKQKAECVVEAAPVAEELTAEPVLATEELVPVVEQDVQDEPTIATQVIEEPSETPAHVDKPAAEAAEPKAEAAEPVIDTQLAASAEVTADVDDDNPEQSVAEEPVSNPVQEADKPSEQSVAELVFESNEPDVEPRAVGELSAADALTDPAPTVDESAAASDEPAIPADASETTADSESASRDLQEDTVESVPEENDPSTDTKSIEDPVASLAPVSNDSAVEENPVAPVAVDEKLDTDVGKLSAEAEPVANGMSFGIDEPETAQDVPDVSVEDIDIGSASTPTSAVDESGKSPSNDSPATEHPISDVPVADETSAVSVSDEVDTSESAPKELAESPEQDASERAIAEEAPVAENPAGEHVVQPSEEKESAPVIEVEPVASTPVDDSALGVQGVVEPTAISVSVDATPAPVESVADIPAPVDLDASISDEVVPESAVADEPAPSELTTKEQDVVVMDTPADTDPTKATAEPESVTDSNPDEQPATSTDYAGTQDVDADRSISDEPATVDAAPVVEDSAESVSVVDTPADAAVVIDTSEDLETPAAEPEDPAVVPAADDADAPSAPVTAITEEHAEPPVDSKCDEAVIASEEHVSSSPANEESATKPVGVEGDVKTDIPVDVVDVQPSDTAEKTPVDAQTVEQAALVEQAAEEPIVSDSFVKESAAQEESALPDVEDTPMLVTDVVSPQEKEASEKPASDEPAIEDEAHLPAPADHAPVAVDSSVPEAASDEPSLKTRAVEATDADPAPPHAERDIAPAEEPSPEVSVSNNSPAEDPVSEADVDPVASPVVEPSVDESAAVSEEPTPEQIEIEGSAPEPASNGVVVEDVVVDIPVAEELAPLAATEDTITPVAKEPAIPDAAAEDPVVPVSESASFQPLAEETIAEETAPLSDAVDEAVPVVTEVPALLADAVEAPAAEEIATEKESAGYSEPVPSVEDVASAPTANTSGIEEPAVDRQVSAEALADSACSLGNNDTTPVSGELAETPAIDKSAEAPGSVSNEPISEPLQADEPVTEMEAAPAAEPVTASTIVEDVPAPEPAVQEPAVQEPAVEEPVVEEPTTEYQHISEPVVEEPTALPATKNDAVLEVIDADNVATEAASLEEAAAPEPSIEEPAPDKVAPSAIEKDDLTSAAPAVRDSNAAAEKPNESEVKESADLHAESEQAVVSDALDVEDTAAPEIEESNTSMPVVEEQIPSDSAPILDEPIASSSSEAGKVDAPGAAGAEQDATASASEAPSPAELADAPAPPDVVADAPAVVGIPAEEAVCSAVADRNVVEETVIGATEGGPCSEEQAPHALEVDESATVDADDGKLEYVAPAVDTASTIEPDVADEPTDIPEPTEKEPTVDLADSLATGSALKDAVPDSETTPIVADVSEDTSIVPEGTVDEPVPVATAEDNHSTTAPEPGSDEPTADDVAVMERDISADEPAAETQELAKKSTDEPAVSPAAINEPSPSEQAASDDMPVALALADADDSAPTNEPDANLSLETSAVEEAVPDAAEPLAAQDPVVEEASLDVNSATVDQAVESVPAAGIQTLEPSPAVEVPVAENATHEEAYDKPINSEDAVVDDIVAETPEAEDASTSAVSIPDEPKIVAESADALDIDNTVPEITPEILVPGDAGVPASLDEELVSRDLATEAVNSDKPDAAVISAPEDFAELSVLDDASKQVEPAIASSDAELVGLAPSADSEQHEALEQPSNLEAATDQQPNDEHVAPSDIADVASEPRDLEDKPTADEPSIPAESIAAATEVPVAETTAATNETAELSSDEPSTERSLEEESTLPPNEPSADKKDEATEETPSAEPAKEASVDVAPVSTKDATVEPISVEAAVETPVLVESKPTADLADAEDQVSAQPSSDDIAKQEPVPEPVEDKPEIVEASDPTPTQSDAIDANEGSDAEHTMPLIVDDANNDAEGLVEVTENTADQIDSEPVTAVEARDSAMIDASVPSDADKEILSVLSEPATPIIKDASAVKEKLDISSDIHDSAKVIPVEEISKTVALAPETSDELVLELKEDAPESRPEDEDSAALAIAEETSPVEPTTEIPGNPSDVEAQKSVVMASSEESLDVTDPADMPVIASVQESSESFANERLVEGPQATDSAEPVMLDSTVPASVDPAISDSDIPAVSEESVVERLTGEEPAAAALEAKLPIEEAQEESKSNIADDSVLAEPVVPEALLETSQDKADPLAEEPSTEIAVDSAVAIENPVNNDGIDTTPEGDAADAPVEISQVDPILSAGESSDDVEDAAAAKEPSSEQDVDDPAAVEEDPNVNVLAVEAPVAETSTLVENSAEVTAAGPTEEGVPGVSDAAVANVIAVNESIESTISEELSTESVVEEPDTENTAADSTPVEEPAAEVPTEKIDQNASDAVAKELETVKTTTVDKPSDGAASDENPGINDDGPASGLRTVEEQFSTDAPTDSDKPEANTETVEPVNDEIDTAVSEDKLEADVATASVSTEEEHITEPIVGNDEVSEIEKSATELVVEPVTESTVEPAANLVIEPTTKITTEAIIDLAAEPASEPVSKSIAEPIVEAATEPVTESVVANASEPIGEAVADPNVDTVAEPITEPTGESAADAIEESSADPAVEPAAEPVARSVAEPIDESATVAVEDSVVEPIAKPATESEIMTEGSAIVPEHTTQEEPGTTASAVVAEEPEKQPDIPVATAQEPAASASGISESNATEQTPDAAADNSEHAEAKPTSVAEPIASSKLVAMPADTQPAQIEDTADVSKEQGADDITPPAPAKGATGDDGIPAQRSYDEVDSVMYPTVSERNVAARPAKLDIGEKGARTPTEQDSAAAATPSYVMHYPESLFGDTASITPGIITIEDLHAAQKASAVVGVSTISATTAGRRSRDSGFHGSDGGDFTVGQRMKRFISGKRGESPRGRVSSEMDSRDVPTSPKSMVSGILADTREKLSSQHRTSRGSHDGKRMSGAPSATVVDEDEDLKHASPSIPGSFPSVQASGRHSESETAARLDSDALQDESPLSSEGEGTGKDRHRRHTILGVIKRMFR
ncbi:hypothetical protein IW140_000845 [Coemansia sp. RSA 1813]|nr:hypothetical protein IW140_000845 [Coemansia sp. RSA 1813]